MLKNVITIFIQVDHYTNPNEYLECISDILIQNTDNKFTIEIVTLTTNQVHPEVQKLYSDVQDIKNRFDAWPENISLKYALSDDNSFNKIRNYTDNISNGEYGELVTFKSVAPIKWYKNHLLSHWNEYKLNKNIGWLLSRLEIKDLSKIQNEKENTFSFRLEDFPSHIDQIIPDELFITHDLCNTLDFNVASILQKTTDNVTVSIFHVGKFVTDELIPRALEYGLKGHNPQEITICQWIDIEKMKKTQAELKEIKNIDKIKENEDGSISFLESEQDDGSIVFLED